MTSKKQFLKGGAVLSGSQVVGQLCSLGRNVVVARMVTPADFGVAAIFVMVVAFLEMVSNLSLDRLLVQASDGDETIFQDVAQFLQAFRGIIICLILLMSAGLLAELFSVPEAKDSFLVLAFIPLINGFCHLDPKRIEREMRFWPGASVELTSQIIVLLIAWPVVQWYGDYRAMLALLLVKVAIMFIGSQIVAQRPYRWSLNKTYIKRFTTFGWPLLINGLLLFGILQGDRFIMGAAKKMFNSSFSMTDVGYYSAAFTLAMIPAMMISRVSSSLLFPMLAKVKNEPKDFLSLSKQAGGGFTMISSCFMVVFVLLGDRLLAVVYGEQYLVAGSVMGWLCIMWAIRIIRMLPASIAMSQGHTKNVMGANVIRVMLLAGVFFVVILDMDIMWVAIVGLIGEALAYIGTLFFNRMSLAIPYNIFVKSSFVFGGYAVITALLKRTFFVGVIDIPWGTFIIILLGYVISLGIIYRSEIRGFTES